jgi:glycerophosphoryl diester phosphodiesterase
MTIVIGHKGAPRVEHPDVAAPGEPSPCPLGGVVGPENRVASFVRARQVGIAGVELDVRRAAEARLAVWHDPLLPDGRPLLTTSWDELAGAVDDLPAVLDACAGLRLVNVEIKNWPYDDDFDDSLGIADDVAKALATRPPAERAALVVSCFHRPTVDRAAEVLGDLAPEVATAWLLWNVDDPEEVVTAAVESGYGALHPHFTAVTAELIELAHSAGVAVNCWTCNDLDQIRSLADLGTDGIITDVPEAAQQALGT